MYALVHALENFQKRLAITLNSKIFTDRECIVPQKPITFARLDICNVCQLDCRGCDIRKLNYGARGRGYITLDNFRKFLELNPLLEYLYLSNYGETFLHPEFPEIMRIAHEKGVELLTENNFNTVSDEILEAVVKYKMNYLQIALDGACQETYSWYRRGGNFDKVIENIKRLNAVKKKHNSELPRLVWQYIILSSNNRISEIKKAKEMAKSLGMNISFVRDWGGFVPENREEVEKETGLSFTSDDEITSSIHLKRFIPCDQLFTRPQVNWDGRFFGCCHNIQMSFGADMFKISIDEFLQSKIIRDAREMVLGGRPKALPCLRCPYYRKMAESGKFPTEAEMYEPHT
jgi:MoaA/NifB/PqqE/SkfB family radical SAM enzyme